MPTRKLRPGRAGNKPGTAVPARPGSLGFSGNCAAASWTQTAAIMDSSQERRVFVVEARPHLNVLLEFAGRELHYHEARGDLAPGELSAEQVVGETLLRAYYDRGKRPPSLAFRSWLLGLEQRVLGRLLDPDERARGLWSVTGDELLPEPLPAREDDAFWDWYQPDDAGWDDLGPSSGSGPDDLHEALGLPPRLRRAWVLHDRYSLSVPEVAVALRAREQTVAQLIRTARTRLSL